MVKKICLISLVLISLAAIDTASGAPMVLVENGRDPMVIHTAKDAPKRVRTAVADLARCLSKMSGANFKINADGSDSDGIVVGTLDEFPNQAPDVRKSLAIKNTYDGKEAYVIRTTEKRLLLLGATELGASHAVYRLLEELGCRWFFPSEAWEVIPSKPTISVSLKVDDRPAILNRDIWYQWGFWLGDFRRRAIKDYRDWCRRNRMDSSLKVNAGHAWGTIIRKFRKEFKKHPEYFAVKGERDKVNPNGSKFCPSNPEVIKLCEKYAVEYFDKHPDRDMVSMDPSDGGGHCRCAKCLAKGKISNRVFSLVNKVAEAVERAHPGKMVGCLAYNFHSEPPDFKLRKNVFVQIATEFTRGKYSFRELMDLWPKHCSNIGYYDYLSVYQWNHDMPPGGKGANITYLRKAIPEFLAKGAVSVSFESGNNWGLNGRGYYVANKLMWNPNVDVNALLEDFYSKAFGPAASAMKAYYDAMAPDGTRLWGDFVIAEAFENLRKAAELTKNRPDVTKRLNQLKCYLEYVRLYKLEQKLRKRSRGNPTAKEKAMKTQEEIFRHVYRTRYMYMNHWAAIRQMGVRIATRKYGGKPYVTMDEPGVHTLNLHMAKDGFVVNRILLTPDVKYVPKKAPAESPRVAGVFQEEVETTPITINASDYAPATSVLNKAGTEWKQTKRYPGCVPNGAMELAPDAGKFYRKIGKGPRLDYKINFKRAGKYYIWLEALAPHNQSNAIHVGLDGKFVHTADKIYCNSRKFKWISYAFDGALNWDSDPWRNSKPYTPEEIEENFRKGLAFFKPVGFKIDRRSFSYDLVPALFPDLKESPDKFRRKDANGNSTKRGWGYFQGGAKNIYALYSFHGEPVEYDILLGIHPAYRNGRDAECWLSPALSSDEKIWSRRFSVKEKKWHHVAAKVPKPGVYFLSVRDSSAGFCVAPSGATPLTWVLAEGKVLHHADYMQPQYFYVPKGRKSFQFYWLGTQTPMLYNPDGKVALQGWETGKPQMVPVPEGMDGRLWMFRKLRGISLWLFNVPPFLSEYPEDLLIPIEVAKKDCLRIPAKFTGRASDAGKSEKPSSK